MEHRPLQKWRASENTIVKSRNKFLLVLTSLMCCFLVGCDKEDDDNNGGAGTGNDNIFVIRATVENGNAYNSKIDSVKFFGGDEPTNLVASGAYVNGGFTLTPSPSKYFEGKVGDLLEPGMTASDLDAKICASDDVDIYAYKDGIVVGYFDYRDDHFTETGIWYVDRDVTISGSTRDSEGETIFNLPLKKGWNMVFYLHTEHSGPSWQITTNEPGGMKWYFVEC